MLTTALPAPGRNLADVAEVTDGALVEDGHEEAEAADEDVGRSPGGLVGERVWLGGGHKRGALGVCVEDDLHMSF